VSSTYLSFEAPNGTRLPLLLLGFGLFILGIFLYIEFCLNDKERNKTLINFGFLSGITLVFFGFVGILLFLISSPTLTEGTISVSSFLDDTSISLDGAYKVKSPIRLNIPKQGFHNVTLNHAGYEDLSLSLNTDPDKNILISPIFTSTSKNGSISISSPANASIYLDGKYEGETPITLYDIGQGSHDISLKLKENDNTEGSISVLSNPGGASINLDGMYQGETPKILENVTQGSHTIDLNLAGYDDFSQNINVVAGKTIQISKKLTKSQNETGAISVFSSPDGASVYLDDEKKGETPTTLNNIGQGSHKITLRLTGYKDKSLNINVVAGETTSINEKLDPEIIPEIEIISPSNNAAVQMNETVVGTAKNIPEGYEIWILVYPYTVNQYYPQSSKVIIQNDGWSVPVGIGDNNNSGTTFDIVAVLANQTAQEKFNNYISRSEASRSWSWIEQIPDGAKEYSRITVTRM
jgi:hypothetical protein